MDSELMKTLNADQQRGLENIRAAAARIWAVPLHRYFTDHTVAHSERVIALLENLTAGMMATEKCLTPTEVYVLLAAAYLHDVGMQNERFADGDIDEIRRQHNDQTAEMIFAVYEDPANAFSIPLAMDPALVEAVALVAKGHRQVDLSDPAYNPLVHGGETLRPRLLAALLRFGDELDIDYRRVYLEQMKLLALPLISQLHWWKCHYVGGVSIEDEYVRVSYRFPQDRPDYEGLIIPLVETEVRQKLADLEEIFRADGVKVALGRPQVRLMRLVKPLPAEVERLAQEWVAGERGHDLRTPARPTKEERGGGHQTSPQGTPAPPPSRAIFDMSGQHVNTQINIAGDATIDHIGPAVNTGGGEYIDRQVQVRNGDFVAGDKNVGGDEVRGNKTTMGGVSGGSAVAVGEGTGAKVSHGDTFSGDFRGAIVNVKSTLKDVNQSIGQLPRASDESKAELERLIGELDRALERATAVAPEKAAEAEAVAKLTESLVATASAEKPNRSMLEITGDGLKAAAKNIADVMPSVLDIAVKIVTAVAAFST